MDPITRRLVETVRQITEQNKTTLTPTPGIDGPVDAQITSGQYDPEKDQFYREHGYTQTVKSGGEELPVKYDAVTTPKPSTPEIHPSTGQRLAGPPRPSKLRLAGPPVPTPEIYKTQTDANGNPVTDEHGNPRVISTVPVKKKPNIGGTHDNKLLQPDLKEAAMSDSLKAGLASLIIGGGIGAAGGVATPHLANLRSTIQDKMGQVVGVENAGNIERSKQEVRSQLGLGANTPATTRAAVGAGLGGLAGLIQSWRKRNNV
jgi:hypothetical protein